MASPPRERLAARQVTMAAMARKEQVAGMVGRLLGIREEIPDDASDALAMAFCGATTRPFGVLS